MITLVSEERKPMKTWRAISGVFGKKKNKTENTEKAKNTMVLILEELCILNVAGKFVHYVCLSISKDPISVSVCISGRMFPILCEKL